MGGGGAEEIEAEVERVTVIVIMAIKLHMTKIKMITFPNPEINKEMTEVRRVKILMTKGVNYLNNRSRLTRLRE